LRSGDITQQAVDVIVNAANSSLLGGGGVDGAIHRAGGPEILAECKRLRADTYRDGLPPGEAVATTAGLLPARWVVHTVGPVHSATEDGSAVLAACHDNTLRLAARLGADSCAFPAISTGAYAWPVESAAEIALNTVRRRLDARDGFRGAVRFVLFDAHTLSVFTETADRLGVTLAR
jgi:O-acetyl-ADP-ribose deacetylase (regulator of RNase III)